MTIALAHARHDLVFHSDCLSLVEAVAGGRLEHILPLGHGWTVEHVPRSSNKRAHALAGGARRDGQRPNPAAPTRSREWLEAHPVPRWSPADRQHDPAPRSSDPPRRDDTPIQEDAGISSLHIVVTVERFGERYRATTHTPIGEDPRGLLMTEAVRETARAAVVAAVALAQVDIGDEMRLP